MPKMAQTADKWETGCVMAQMRIKDIAAEAGVSPATVSRYLNNRPGQMTEETRARIAAVIERTGYRPRAAARNLRSSRTNLIGVILADIANPFSSAMLEGLSASAAARGCSLMTAISGNDPAKEAESLTRLIDAGVDGLVVNTCGGNDEAIAAAAGRLPVVLLDRDVADGGVDLVTSNNRELVAGLVDELATAGSERLCLLTEASDDSPVRRERAEAMCRALGIGLDMRVKTMSKGTKEKLQLLLVMSRAAKLYLLDEPIAGVDPAARDFILQTILTNYSPESTVLISTHLIADIEPVLDEVIFLKEGRVVRHDSTDNIRGAEGKSVDEVFREVFRTIPMGGEWPC